MEAVLLVALVAMLVVLAMRAAGDRRAPVRVPVYVRQRRVARRR